MTYNDLIFSMQNSMQLVLKTNEKEKSFLIQCQTRLAFLFNIIFFRIVKIKFINVKTNRYKSV